MAQGPNWRAASARAVNRLLLWLVASLCFGTSTLDAQPAVTNRVLQLDGTNSYVQLPAHIFDGQKAITVEAWVNWQSFGSWSRVFDFGKRDKDFLVANRSTNPNLELELFPNTNTLECYRIRAVNVLKTDEWCHVAAVAD